MGPSVISVLVIVVFDIETDEPGVINAQCAAGIVDVLAIQRLFGMLGAHRVIPQQCLELVVLGECDDLQDCAELREDLVHIQGHWVEEVFHNDPLDQSLACQFWNTWQRRRLPRPGF